MLYGVDYYPEQWGLEQVKKDVVDISQLGINVVRMGEFCYSLLEDKSGNISTQWLKQVIDLFYNNGIQTILGTPTACPPKRLYDLGIGVVGEKGEHFAYGSRRHYCFNSKIYQQHIDAFLPKLAQQFKDLPGVIGFQIDNEIGGDKNSPCYCDSCRKEFISYLKEKFKTIEDLNRELGLTAWNLAYDSFEQIDPPSQTQTVGNPSILLHYKIFSSISAQRFVKKQFDILKAIKPSWQVCTNIFGLSAVTDNYALTQSHDYVAFDDYPSMTFDEIDRTKAAVGCKLCYGYLKKPFVRMEMQSGTPGADILFPTPKAGEIMRNVFQAVANGANGIVFFRYRTALMGAEQYWHGILGHDGVKGRLYNEVKKTSEMLKQIVPHLNFQINNKVAIIVNPKIDWAFKIQPLMLDYDYFTEVCAYARVLDGLGVGYDVINSAEKLDGYKMVIAPNYLFSESGFADKLEKFAFNGGTVVMDFRCGVKNENNLVVNGSLPNAYRDLLGLTIAEYGILNKNSTKIKKGDIDISAKKWYDYIVPSTCQIIYVFNSGEISFINNLPAVTKNNFGNGAAYYIGTKLYESDLENVISLMLTEANIQFNKLECGIITSQMDGLKFVINFSDAQKKYDAGNVALNLINGESKIVFNLNGGEIAVLK